MKTVALLLMRVIEARTEVKRPGSRDDVFAIEQRNGLTFGLQAQGDGFDMFIGTTSIDSYVLDNAAARRLGFWLLSWWLFNTWCGLRTALWNWAQKKVI